MSDLGPTGGRRPKRRGLVIGRFNPPHEGHHRLIGTALEQVEELYVVVCGSDAEEPDAGIRSRWLAEVHPGIHPRVVDAARLPEDPAARAREILLSLGFKPDLLFAPDALSGEFAQYLGCALELVPSLAPAVGTRIRPDPLEWWDALSPPVRGYYAIRICLVGAESTGKTTLARQLAFHYETEWVPEYGREYTYERLAREGDAPWRTEEFIRIARAQCEMEDAAARRCNRVLICDTDAFATAIWHRRYMGHASPEVEAIAAQHRAPDLYLVTDVETPFAPDEIRDGEEIRGWMHAEFIRQLDLQQRPYRLITGDPGQRFVESVAAIDELLALGAQATRPATTRPVGRS